MGEKRRVHDLIADLADFGRRLGVGQTSAQTMADSLAAAENVPPMCLILGGPLSGSVLGVWGQAFEIFNSDGSKMRYVKHYLPNPALPLSVVFIYAPWGWTTEQINAALPGALASGRALFEGATA